MRFNSEFFIEILNNEYSQLFNRIGIAGIAGIGSGESFRKIEEGIFIERTCLSENSSLRDVTFTVPILMKKLSSCGKCEDEKVSRKWTHESVKKFVSFQEN